MADLHFAVLGYPIGHTMSPFLHERLFALDGLSAEYGVLSVAPEALAETERTVLRRLDGYNLTIPLKTHIIPLLDDTDGKAKRYASVNTVKNGLRRVGYSTDPLGFSGALRDAQISLAGRVAVLGCGGAARVFVFESVLAGCAVTIAVRPSGLARAEALAQDARACCPNAEVSVCTLDALSGEWALVMNATPVGMHPHRDECPVSASVLSRTHAVFDAVYNPEDTVLLQTAQANGAKICGGMKMLVLQAAEAHRIWVDAAYRKADLDALCTEATAEMRRKFGA